MVAQICDRAKTAQAILADNENTLTIKERSLSSGQVSDILTSNTILDDTQSVPGDRHLPEKKRAVSKSGSPIVTAQGTIYPAQGITRRADGTIILTANNTDRDQGIVSHSRNCAS